MIHVTQMMNRDIQCSDVCIRAPVVMGKIHAYPDDVNTLSIGKRLFYQYAQYSIEYIYDTDPTKEVLVELKDKSVDLFTFVQRSFIDHKHSFSFPMEDEIIGLLQISSFDNWWKLQIRKKERNMVRRAEKKGVIVRPVRIDEDFIRGAHEIYNETPIRQGRRYIGYGISLADVRRKFSNLRRSEVLGAYGDKNRLMGLLWIIYGDRAARIGSFVSVTSQRDVSPNNALMAELARRCCEKGFHFIIYERMGYLPSLDSFKRHNGFKGYAIPRYYVPLSKKGALALKLGVHKGIEHALPPRLSRALLPAYSLATRVMPLRILEKIT